jgi:Cu(I)/Ag(I) efflux system membrane protein CusA/SilA
MINWLIERSLKNRFIILALYIGLAGWGYWALLHTPIDAIPDLSENQVIVFTDWPGRSPKEVEDQITYPLSTNLQGLPGVKAVRSSSAFGFSMINLIYEDSTDLYFARTRVLERLNLAQTMLPAGVAPTLGPDATGVGQIFWYSLEGPYDLMQLRTLQDWFLRYQLNSVPGVAEVASVGGYVQQYQVEIDQNRLRAYGLPLSAIVEAVMRSNKNVGGNVVEQSGTWSIVRGLGLIENTDDIEHVVIGAPRGTPVFVRDVATVKIVQAFRQGALDRNGKESVGGVVISRYGANQSEVIAAVKAKIESLKAGLPAGVTIVPFYDRSELIGRAVNTLKHSLIEEIILVTLAHIIFLMHFRSILIVTVPLPLAVLTSFLFMHYLGITSNIMSLAGIAIAIGVLVDAGIVVTENAFRYVEKRGINPKDRPGVWQAVLDSTRLVGRPIFFSMAIIILAFVPVFALTGREGKLFHPLAFTKTFAMIGATIMAVTLVPVLCTFLLGGKMHAEADNPVMKILAKIYRPVLRTALSHRLITVSIAASLFLGALFLSTRIGTEFMPPLNEGDLMFMPITDPSVSLDQAIEIASKQDEIIKDFPEVKQVVAKVGRAETSTDPAPVNMTETIIQLKPESEWRRGVTRESLVSEMNNALLMPGVSNIWTRPIMNRIEMLSTGIRTPVGIKLYGSDLKVLEERARAVAAVLRQIPGASDVYPEQISGQPYLDIKVGRDKAARYGLRPEDLSEIVETAIGENNLTIVLNGRQRFPVKVRYAREFRNDIAALKNLLVTSPNGAQVPLGEIADIREVDGPSMISSENGLMRATVLANVRNRDQGSFVNEANRIVAQQVALPPGYYLEWTGEYQNQIQLRDRMMLVLPIVLIVIYLLLYFTYRSFLEAAHVLLAVPFALTGGVYLLYALGYNFSAAVWVGFIALFGTAVQTGVVMVIYLNEAVERKQQEQGTLTHRGLLEAVMDGALLRLRPKVMTVSTVVAGLLPIMWSTSTGAEVMKPLATPVLGGMVSSLLHVLIVTPVIFSWLRERELKHAHRLRESIETPVVNTPEPLTEPKLQKDEVLSGSDKR